MNRMNFADKFVIAQEAKVQVMTMRLLRYYYLSDLLGTKNWQCLWIHAKTLQINNLTYSSEKQALHYK